MLAGNDNMIKPDRMISRFLFGILKRKLSLEEMHEAIGSAHDILAKDYHNLTPRHLDHMIWRYQRAKGMANRIKKR